MAHDTQGAHRRIVANVISGVDIEARRQYYPAIARNFSSSLLSSFSSRPPYYCHFMQWRLATLRDAQLQRVDALLQCAEGIPGWKAESQSLVRSPDFAEFWSLLWQLQVAEYLRTRGFELRWGDTGGPDLKAQRESETLFIECLAVRKFFAALVFIEEILGQLHPRLRLHHQLFLPMAVPRDALLDSFLSDLVGRLDVPGRLDSFARQANQAYPVIIPLPSGASNLTVYVEGVNANAYQPGVLSQGHGLPDNYLSLILREAVSNKLRANGLQEHRPNVLAINFLLGDHQVAMRVGTPTAPDLQEVIDVLAFGVLGIDEAIHPGSVRCIEGTSGSIANWIP